MREVPGVQEAVVVDGLRGRRVVAEVTRHHVGPLEPQFAGVAETLSGQVDFVTGLGVDDLAAALGTVQPPGSAAPPNRISRPPSNGVRG